MITPSKVKTGSSTKATNKTKKAQLITLLSRKAGATIVEASEKFGWQQHTTRAALTGLRKAGYEIEICKSKKGGPSRYHIVKQVKELDDVTV